MNKMKFRLLTLLLLFCTTTVVSLGLFFNQFIRENYIDTLQERLQKEALSVVSAIDASDGREEVTSQLARESRLLDVRFVLFTREGDKLYETSVADELEEQLDDYISEKIVEEQLSLSRYYDVQQKYQNAFQVIPFNKPAFQKHYLLVNATLVNNSSIQQQMIWLTVSFLTLTLIVLGILTVRLVDGFTKPVDDATRVATELAKGNYRERMYENHHEIGTLSHSINLLAQNLEEMSRTQMMQQDRLRTLIENMGSGLIVIDNRGMINLVNREFKRVFNLRTAEYLDRPYHEALKFREIISIVEEIFITELNVRKQIVLPLQIERRFFEVYGAPIIGRDDEWRGIVLVFHDITGLKKLEQMRKEFVASVSHELKTPVTSIKGFTETLLDGALEDRGITEQFLSIILKESDRLQDLIQDLLDLSKIEQQGFTLQLQPVNVHHVLEEILLLMHVKAEEKEIEFELDEQNAKLVIDADYDRMKQIFLNLVANAIHYTPAGGKVTVRVVEKRDEVQIHVEDTGIGIEKEDVARIFERFYRVDKARSRNSGGTGLGLAIVKHLVEAHHGLVSVKSEVGVGSTFSVHLPKRQ